MFVRFNVKKKQTMYQKHSSGWHNCKSGGKIGPQGANITGIFLYGTRFCRTKRQNGNSGLVIKQANGDLSAFKLDSTQKRGASRDFLSKSILNYNAESRQPSRTIMAPAT